MAGILPVGYAFTQIDCGSAFLVGSGILVIEQVWEISSTSACKADS